MERKLVIGVSDLEREREGRAGAAILWRHLPGKPQLVLEIGGRSNWGEEGQRHKKEVNQIVLGGERVERSVLLAFASRVMRRHCPLREWLREEADGCTRALGERWVGNGSSYLGKGSDPGEAGVG